MDRFIQVLELMHAVIANWKRLVCWSLLIFLVFQIIGLFVFVATPVPEAGNFASQLSAFALYFMFLRRTESSKVLLGVSLFLLVQLIDVAVALSLARSTYRLLDLPGTAISFAVCVLAYLAALMSSHNSSKPKPLNPSA